MGKKRIIKQTEEELLKESDKVEAKARKEIREPVKRVTEGKLFITSTYNNTLITLTDLKGNVLGWVSAGNIGFKGNRKATPFAASKVADAIYQLLEKLGIEKVEVLVKGIGSGRESAIRSLAAKGLEIVAIRDITPIPHNGCRPPKARRV